MTLIQIYANQTQLYTNFIVSEAKRIGWPCLLAMTSVVICILFLAICVQQAQAETLTWQEPMVIELNLDKPGIYKSKVVPTEGIITSITANWDFQGEVSLQVSTDAGRRWLPVVNGVPLLIPGAGTGNQLRYKVHIGQDSNVGRLILAYTDTSGVAYSFGSPELSGFRFRMPIYIAYSGEEKKDLFNYPVRIAIPAKIKGLDAAVRFTAADARTLLPYYRELEADYRLLRGIKGQSAFFEGSNFIDFWVRVPQITRDGVTVYFYYGNPQAQDLSCGKDVFEFFDDFEGKVLDHDKWEFLPGLKGEGCLVKGRLFLKDGRIKSSKFSVRDDSLIEFKARMQDSHTDIQAILSKFVFYSSGFPGAGHAIAEDGQVEVNLDSLIEAGQDYIYQIIRCGNKLTFARRGSGEGVKTVFAPEALWDKPLELGLKSTSALGCKQGAYFDWVRVRPLFQAKPCIVSFGRIEPANLAQYTDKYYISRKVAADFPVRIIITDAGGDLSISTDGGKIFTRLEEISTPAAGKDISVDDDSTPSSKEDSFAAAVYYYASKGDFRPGKSLCWRMELEGAQEALLKKISLTYYPGRITLLLPNNGKVFSFGSQQEILWSAEEYERTYPLRLEYSVNQGLTYYSIAEVENSASYTWQRPEGLKGEVLIRISDFYAPEVFDVSDNLVEIAGE